MCVCACGYTYVWDCTQAILGTHAYACMSTQKESAVTLNLMQYLLIIFLILDFNVGFIW